MPKAIRLALHIHRILMRRQKTAKLLPSGEDQFGRRATELAVSSRQVLTSWSLTAIAIGFLYFGRSVLIPITLAAFLAFLLAPIVATIRRAKVPKPLAVLLAMLIALGVISTTAVILIGQAAVLKSDAPVYAQRIAEKAERARATIQQRFTLPAISAREQSRRPTLAERADASLRARQQNNADTGIVPVAIRSAPPALAEQLQTYVMPLLAPVETGLIVLVVTLFFMVQKEDVRDRMIRLMGAADLHRTTIALDDAATRLSRYFFAQAVVNAAFGGVIWIGLWLLGIPAPGLWGILAGLLRFVPYVGILIAALGPLGLAAATAPGLGLVFAVAGLFLIIEPLVGYAIEPMVYGRSTGLSPVSVVVSSIFWAWIWGPIGLVLAMPLTLMLVVLGRHIPAFALFDILLGDRPPLSAAEAFYQRALAMRPEEAIENAEEQLDQLSLQDFYDSVALPGLRLAAADVERGAVERSSMKSVCETVVQLVEALRELPGRHGDDFDRPACSLQGRSIMCVPGRGPLDVATAAIAAHLLEQAGATIHRVARETMGQFDAAGDDDAIDTVCIVGLFSAKSARRLVQVGGHFRSKLTDATICVGVDRYEDGPADGDPPLANSFGAFVECVAAAPNIQDSPHLIAETSAVPPAFRPVKVI
jgi:predicted PurR-regulated permease PerM